MTFSAVNKELFLAFLSYNIPIFAITLLLAIPLGFLVAFASMSKIKWISRSTQTFVWVVRGRPLMILVMMMYYGPSILFHVNYSSITYLDRMIPISLAFIINYACYFSEIFRGGIESIPKGQYEAGQVLGMTRTQTFFKVVILQVVKRILPATSNEVMTLIKDTALSNIIGVVEVIRAAKDYASLKGIIWPTFYVAIFFLAAVGIFTLLFKFFEKKLSYFKA